jgi:hypothetical protein
MLGKNNQRWTAILLAASTLALGALILPTSAFAQSSSQPGSTDSVADAARRSREDKKNAPKDKKVYTDDDVRPAPAPANTQSAAPPSGTAPASGDVPAAADATKAPGTDAAAPADKTDEKGWRSRFQARRDQIATAEKDLDILQREEEKAQIQYYPDPQKALEEGYSRKDINDKDAKIAAKKDEIAKLKQGLSDLEDELHKSGGDPGWARE